MHTNRKKSYKFQIKRYQIEVNEIFKAMYVRNQDQD